MVAALGAYVQILTGLSAGLVGVIGGVICMTALSVVQPTAYNISKRYLPFPPPVLAQALDGRFRKLLRNTDAAKFYLYHSHLSISHYGGRK